MCERVITHLLRALSGIRVEEEEAPVKLCSTNSDDDGLQNILSLSLSLCLFG